MTRAAADWSTHHSARRFDLGPPRDELTALAATLDELLGRLQESLGYERRLTGEIAHELRTPISRIRTQAEVALRSRASTAVLRRVLTDVVDDTELLARTIDTLLQTAATRDPGSPVGVPVEEVVDRALTESGLGHAIVTGVGRSPVDPVDIPAPTQAVLAADPYTAVRALIPVLGNARDYGRGQVHVSVSCAPGQVTIAVHDDGPGFTDDDLERLFQPGVRGAASGHTSGAGLGLPLARRLARSCGGDVTVSPETGAGARVLVTFPTLRPGTDTSPHQSRPPSAASAPSQASASGRLSIL